MSRLRRLRRAGEEGGFALVSAMLVLMICGGVGIATLSVVDTQQRESGNSRTRETAFNLAEGALNAQIYSLSRRWPGQGAGISAPITHAYTPCDQSTTGAHCPDPAMLAGLFSSADTAEGAAWRTSVHDNSQPSQNYYDDSETLALPGFDANGDGKLWVRAQGAARGRQRTLVALVRVESRHEEMPRSALLAGALDITNEGRKVIIDAQGNAAAPGLVAVRCDPAVVLKCAGQPEGAPGHVGYQIAPYNIITGYDGGNALSPEAIARLEATAVADGTWYASCPAALPDAAVVWIDSGTCSYVGNDVVNSPEAPGIVLMNGGRLSLGGTVKFHGILYHVNPALETGVLVRIHANAQVIGGVIVDGLGAVDAGSSHVNITIDDKAYNNVRSYGTAGLIQNTWREIQPEA